MTTMHASGEQPTAQEAGAGRYYEQFEVGQIFEHRLRRTIEEADNVIFRTLTNSQAPSPQDVAFMNTTESGDKLVHGGFVLSLMIGISMNEMALGTTVANMGWDEVRFTQPVYQGDTLRFQSEVLETAPSRGRSYAGVVTFSHRAFNQRDERVASCARTVLVLRAPVRRQR